MVTLNEKIEVMRKLERTIPPHWTVWDATEVFVQLTMNAMTSCDASTSEINEIIDGIMQVMKETTIKIKGKDVKEKDN